MKRILIALALLLPLVSAAKKNVDNKYLAGAVPEKNGIIQFEKTFSVPGTSEQQLFSSLTSFVCDSLVAKGIEGLRTRLISDGKEDGIIVAKVEEYMIFKKRFLNLDRTRFRYQIAAQAKGNKVKLTISQISYYYNEDMEGNNGVTYKGEEWITDKEALNAKGTRLYPRSGKFRIKTIDRVEAIFESSMDMFEAKTAQGKRQRHGVVEDEAHPNDTANDKHITNEDERRRTFPRRAGGTHTTQAHEPQ